MANFKWKLDLKALKAFRSGREYPHVKYVKNRGKQGQRNYLIMLKKINILIEEWKVEYIVIGWPISYAFIFIL